MKKTMTLSSLRWAKKSQSSASFSSGAQVR
jgi:hypothetical protein